MIKDLCCACCTTWGGFSSRLVSPCTCSSRTVPWVVDPTWGTSTTFSTTWRFGTQLETPKICWKDDHSWGNEDHRIPPPFMNTILPAPLESPRSFLWSEFVEQLSVSQQAHLWPSQFQPAVSCWSSRLEHRFWLESGVTSLSSEPGPFSQTESNVGVYLCKHRIYQLSYPFSSHPICTSWLSLIWQCIEWNKGPQTMKPYSHHPMGHTTCSFTPLAPSRWFQSHSPPPVFPLAPALVHACASAQGCGCACPQTSE